MKLAALGLAAGALLLFGSTTSFAQTGDPVAELRSASGATVGAAIFSTAPGGVILAVKVQGLPPGQHGIHVHMTGKCDGPDFMSAGAHFNPANKMHGLENPQGHHAGDLPNLTVGSDGSGTFQGVLDGVTLGTDANGLFKTDGTALVIHADPDDEKTDPSGNSGARIACGVITRGGAPAAQPSPAAKPAAPAAPAAAPAAQPSPAAKPAAQPAQAPAPAAKPAASPAPAQAPRPAASPAALPRTGTALPLAESMALPAALAGIGAVVGGLALWRRRR